MKDYYSYIEESYLLSNNAPLYHFTSLESLESILYDNSLKRGFFKNSI